MSDLKVTFDKLSKTCKEANEEWKKMMKENNPFDTTSKIAKDIADRQDKEKALEFTKCIGELLRKNGVTTMVEEYRQGPTLKDKNLIEEYYGVAITGLDFTEHDKKFKDEITQLKNDLEKTYNQLMEVEKDAHEQIAELEKTRSDWVDNAVTWKEKFEKAEKEIKELESELEVKENLMKIKNGLCGNDEMKDKKPIEIAMDIIKGRNIDDLEQIAQHIQVYCRHTRSRRDDTIAF